LGTIEDLQGFFKEDIKKNIKLYVEKNPSHLLIALFNDVPNSEENVQVNVPENIQVDISKDVQETIQGLDKLFGLMKEVNCAAGNKHLDDFQTSIDNLEAYIEKNCKEFKGKELLKVNIASGEEGVSLNVTFGDFPISKAFFKAEEPYQYSDSYIALLRNVKANNKEAELLSFLEKMDAFSRDNKFDEFQIHLCSLAAFIEEQHSDFKGRLRVKVTEDRGVSIFSVKFGDFCIAKSVFRNKSIDVDLFKFETEIIKGKSIVAAISTPKTAKTLLSEVINSSDSLLFEVNLLRLAYFLKKMDKNTLPLQLEVESNEGTSSVALILNGEESRKINFEGELPLNARLFDLVIKDTHNATRQIFQVKEFEDNNVLKLAIEQKAEPKVWGTTITDRASIENGDPLTEEHFARLLQDYHRNINFLPVVSDDEDVLTREKFTALLQKCFSNEAELAQLEFDEKEFYNEFIKLPFAEKKDFLFYCEQNKFNQDALNDVHRQFLELATEKRERLKEVLFGIEKIFLENEATGEVGSKLEFYGTDQQFKDKVSALSIRDQALLLISVDQTYKNQLSLNIPIFSGKLETRQENIYSFKCLPFNPEIPNEVKVEVASQLNFSDLMARLCHPSDSGPFVPLMVVDEKISGIFTISFKNGETTFVEASLKLSDVESTLTIHNADGTVPQACKKIS
jgi:hypothetical protein